jgi:hypothetical protein
MIRFTFFSHGLDMSGAGYSRGGGVGSRAEAAAAWYFLLG